MAFLLVAVAPMIALPACGGGPSLQGKAAELNIKKQFRQRVDAYNKGVLTDTLGGNPGEPAATTSSLRCRSAQNSTFNCVATLKLETPGAPARQKELVFTAKCGETDCQLSLGNSIASAISGGHALGPPPQSGTGTESGPVIRARLDLAGYRVRSQPLPTTKPVPEDAFSVRLGAHTSVAIYVYSSAHEAEAERAAFESLERANPKALKVEQVGNRLYVGTAQEPAELPLGRFDAVVAAAEGRKT